MNIEQFAMAFLGRHFDIVFNVRGLDPAYFQARFISQTWKAHRELWGEN